MSGRMEETLDRIERILDEPDEPVVTTQQQQPVVTTQQQQPQQTSQYTEEDYRRAILHQQQIIDQQREQARPLYQPSNLNYARINQNLDNYIEKKEREKRKLNSIGIPDDNANWGTAMMVGGVALACFAVLSLSKKNNSDFVF